MEYRGNKIAPLPHSPTPHYPDPGIKGSFFIAWSRPEYSFAFFACCQEFLSVSLFLPSRFNELQMFQILLKHKETAIKGQVM